jgi:hypothetical protein
LCGCIRDLERQTGTSLAIRVPTSFSLAEADRIKTNVMEAAMTNVLGSMAPSLAAPVMNDCLQL